MPGWLKWKKPKLMVGTGRQPVPFAIQCVCGRKAEGQRSARYQQVICLDCGEPLFVLPLNVYPAPTIAEVEKEQQPAPNKSTGDSTDTEESGGSRTATATVKKQKKQKGLKKQKREKAKPGPKPNAVPLSKIKRPRKRVVTPFRLTLVAITGVLIGTVWFSIQSSRFESAELTLRTATESGFAAIENKDFLTAATELQQASAAANIVVPQSMQASMLAQMCDQLEVVNNLSADSVIDLIEHANNTRKRQPELWREVLSFSDNTWMVIDSDGRQTTGLSGDAIIEVAFPFGMASADVVIDCPVEPFQELSIGSTPERMVFAAQLSGIDYQDTTPARWIIHLNPKTIVVWSDQSLFDSLGFESDNGEWDQATSELLTRQRKSLGIEG